MANQPTGTKIASRLSDQQRKALRQAAPVTRSRPVGLKKTKEQRQQDFRFRQACKAAESPVITKISRESFRRRVASEIILQFIVVDPSEDESRTDAAVRVAKDVLSKGAGFEEYSRQHELFKRGEEAARKSLVWAYRQLKPRP